METRLCRRCPICSGKTGTILKTVHMCLPEGNPLPLQYHVVTCKDCGFAFADTDACQATYNDYYTNYNMYSQSSDIKKTADSIQAVYDNILHLIQDKIQPNAKILDVGCGSGNLLAYLYQKGYHNLYGLDPSVESINQLNRKVEIYPGEAGITGILGNIFDEVQASYQYSFDLVISNCVIEHIYDLMGYVNKIKTFLKQSRDSYFLVDTPAVEGMPKFLHPIPNYFNHEHINYFSHISLDNLLSNANLYRRNHQVYSGHNQQLFLRGLYQWKEHPYSIVKDTVSSISICEYFQKIEQTENRKTSIQEILQTNDSVILWGAGAYTMQLIGENPDIIQHIACFVDNNTTKCGKRILGKLICSPEQMLYNRSEDPIVICSMRNSQDIQQQIFQMNLPNRIYIL